MWDDKVIIWLSVVNIYGTAQIFLSKFIGLFNNILSILTDLW